MLTLHESNGHKNVMFHDMSEGLMVQANQHMIVCGSEAVLLDPGGHKVYSQLFAKSASVIAPKGLKYLFFSHQDPDIVASANGWLMMTDAEAYISTLWTRFIPHFGIDDLMHKRLRSIPDEGMVLTVGGQDLKVVPAHFLHSAGNFQIYDPISKILYTGDLGASMGQSYTHVEDFSEHVQYMEGFHKRYMPSSVALQKWVTMARTLDIDIIAPQHGAVLASKALIQQFIDWIDGLECGLDVLGEYKVP